MVKPVWSLLSLVIRSGRAGKGGRSTLLLLVCLALMWSVECVKLLMLMEMVTLLYHIVGPCIDNVLRRDEDIRGWPEEVRHASRIADSACPFLYWSRCKKGHAESALHDACRTSSETCLVAQWLGFRWSWWLTILPCMVQSHPGLWVPTLW